VEQRKAGSSVLIETSTKCHCHTEKWYSCSELAANEWLLQQHIKRSGAQARHAVKRKNWTISATAFSFDRMHNVRVLKN